MLAEAEKMEGESAETASDMYDEILRIAPEKKAVSSKLNYLNQVKLGNVRLEGGRYGEAAASFLEARDEVRTDDLRRGNVDRRITSLRSRWIETIAKASAAAGADDDKHYASVVTELATVTRTFEALGGRSEDVRQSVLDDYKKAGGR
jgi:hypothetical protein